jgi:SAM-dependent methyltransferase
VDGPAPSGDRWSSWLLERRHGGGPEAYDAAVQGLVPVRDRVLDGARLEPGDVVLDAGCGDGLIGFGALDRVGREGRVVFADVSAPLLERCRALAEQGGVLDRCGFVEADAATLAPVADASVDVVTTRSVLIYLDREAKAAALRAFARVLRPGGRVSLFEPINRFAFPEPPERFCGYPSGALADLAARVKRTWEDAPTLLDFDERDLLSWAEAAGFAGVRLAYEAELGSAPVHAIGWDQALRIAPNPLVPTLGEALETLLSGAERERFTAHFRPLFERGGAHVRHAVAYLTADL